MIPQSDDTTYSVKPAETDPDTAPLTDASENIFATLSHSETWTITGLLYRLREKRERIFYISVIELLFFVGITFYFDWRFFYVFELHPRLSIYKSIAHDFGHELTYLFDLSTLRFAAQLIANSLVGIALALCTIGILLGLGIAIGQPPRGDASFAVDITNAPAQSETHSENALDVTYTGSGLTPTKLQTILAEVYSDDVTLEQRTDPYTTTQPPWETGSTHAIHTMELRLKEYTPRAQLQTIPASATQSDAIHSQTLLLDRLALYLAETTVPTQLQIVISARANGHQDLDRRHRSHQQEQSPSWTDKQTDEAIESASGRFVDINVRAVATAEEPADSATIDELFTDLHTEFKNGVPPGLTVTADMYRSDHWSPYHFWRVTQLCSALLDRQVTYTRTGTLHRWLHRTRANLVYDAADIGQLLLIPGAGSTAARQAYSVRSQSQQPTGSDPTAEDEPYSTDYHEYTDNGADQQATAAASTATDPSTTPGLWQRIKQTVRRWVVDD